MLRNLEPKSGNYSQTKSDYICVLAVRSPQQRVGEPSISDLKRVDFEIVKSLPLSVGFATDLTSELYV